MAYKPLNWRRLLGSGLALVRPLLDFTRAETAQFCQDMQLKVWEDSTNQDLKYARNTRIVKPPYFKILTG